MNKLQEVKEALELAAKHKYGDGDYTAFFEKALSTLNEYMERLESEDFIKSVMIFENGNRYTEKLALSQVSTEGNQGAYFSNQKNIALYDLKQMRVRALDFINVIKEK